MQSLPTWDPKRWRREAALRELLRGCYSRRCAEVQELSDRVVRASSPVENPHGLESGKVPPSC